MNLKVLMLLIIYYGVLSLVFLAEGSMMASSGYNYSSPVNTSNLQSGEQDTGGIFGSGVSFGRFFGLVTIGVGLPSDTPSWFSFLFTLWQSAILIFTVGFIISSIWNG